jgi:hypothetical protein
MSIQPPPPDDFDSRDYTMHIDNNQSGAQTPQPEMQLVPTWMVPVPESRQKIIEALNAFKHFSARYPDVTFFVSAAHGTESASAILLQHGMQYPTTQDGVERHENTECVMLELLRRALTLSTEPISKRLLDHPMARRVMAVLHITNRRAANDKSSGEKGASADGSPK